MHASPAAVGYQIPSWRHRNPRLSSNFAIVKWIGGKLRNGLAAAISISATSLARMRRLRESGPTGDCRHPALNDVR